MPDPGDVFLRQGWNGCQRHSNRAKRSLKQFAVGFLRIVHGKLPVIGYGVSKAAVRIIVNNILIYETYRQKFSRLRMVWSCAMRCRVAKGANVMPYQYDSIREVGERLRSYRLGRGLTPDDVARHTGLSRAAIYRYEAGQPIKVDVLGKIADFLDVSLTTLLGVGSEYTSSAITFFERMRQIESTADHISVMFGPISYLLTTDAFDAALYDVLDESIPADAADQGRARDELKQILDILRLRKQAYRARRPNILSLVSSAEIEQFAKVGFVGSQRVAAAELEGRRRIARAEISNIVSLIADQPIGVQIGVVEDSMPGTSFQLFRHGTHTQVAVSPFRLGVYSNVRIGVASISGDQESVQLHQQVTETLWKQSLKGDQAIDRLQQILGAAEVQDSQPG